MDSTTQSPRSRHRPKAKPMNRLLNHVTMYRLVLYGLGGLVLISLIIAMSGRLSFAPIELLMSLVLVLSSAFAVNVVFSRIWGIPGNRESWLITALILFFVLQPAHDLPTAIALILAGGVASASKFLIAPFGKLIFNPAAFAAAFVSLLALLPSTWWVGSSALWPFTLLLGLAIILKLRRYVLVVSFFGAALLIQAIQFIVTGHPLGTGLISFITASPFLFLGGVMLTEPSTMPSSRKAQAIFGGITATLFVIAPSIGPFIVYPEVALLIANIYAFTVSPKRRYILTLQRIEKISDRVFNYVFTSNYHVDFEAGQYMEWTLGGVRRDGRGNRRTFTIASSPTEDTIQVGLKYYYPSSTFKTTFSQLQPGDQILAGQVSGSFTLTNLHGRKLALIAGGIGITPFRSMVKQIIDENRIEDIVILYSVADMQELAYMDVFRDASKYGVKLFPFVGNGVDTAGVMTGPINREALETIVPDMADRMFLVSGPNAMVEQVYRSLRKVGVHSNHIHTDFFSGY